MGTRGVYGFRLDGKDYLAYNHFDSYPSYLGEHLAEQVETLRQGGWDTVKTQVRAIRLVTETDKPTPADVVALQAYTDQGVAGGSLDDWYVLLRNAQGDLLAALGSGYMLDGHTFILDSLFCEWGYIVNLDTMQFEVWRGFQETADPNNRYGHKRHFYTDWQGQRHLNDYYPCKLLVSFDLLTVTPGQVVAAGDLVAAEN